MSPHSSRSARRLLLVAAAALSPLASASPAAAVDAPTRIVDLNEAGIRANGWTAAIGPGGREVLLGQPADPANPNSPASLKIRDLVTAKTTAVLPSNLAIRSYSDDLQRFLVSTTTSYDPADTNGATDLYVYDRRTSRGLLATRKTDGTALGSETTGLQISGDGKVVFYSTRDALGADTAYRVAVDTAAVQTIAASSVSGPSDLTGSLIFTTDGIYVGTRKVPIPADVYLPGLAYAGKVADNGSTVVETTGGYTTAALRVIDLSTGVARTVALPSWVQKEYPVLVDVSPDASKALVVISISRGSAVGLRLVLGTVDLKTGAVAQVGNDLPWPGGRAAIVSPDWAFAGVGPSIVQLGSTPIPGSDVVIPTVPPRPATEYLALYEGCKGNTSGWPIVASTRPSLTLNPGAIGISPQVPAKADVVVKNATTGQITNQFTLAPSGRRDLSTGFGNFTYTAKITFKDGTSVTGSKTVPRYTANSCPGPW